MYKMSFQRGPLMLVLVFWHISPVPVLDAHI